LNPQPELAEKWDFSSDGLTLTLTLRQGVKFHSGREFTSEDVKWLFDFAGKDTSVTRRTLFATVKKVETPDKYTAALKVNSINPGIFDILDMLYVVDKETFADRSKTAIGTGPFKLDRYIPNDRAEFVAFKDYWEKEKPYLDRYILRQIPDLASLVVNLEAGAVDAIWRPNYVDIVRLKKADSKWAIDMGAPGFTFYDLGLNVKYEPLRDKRVRQAVAWSVDRARFCRTVLQGMIEPSCLMWPKTSWAHFPDLEGKIGYDLDKAKALLKEAGMEKGFDVELMTSSSRAYGYGELAQMLQADLKKIGVNAKVSDLAPAHYDARMNKGDIQIAAHTYGTANRDPGSLVTAAKSWYNEKEGGWTHFDSAEWDRLRSEMQSTLDQDKRKATARKIQEMALDECMTVVVAPQPTPWVYANYVKGFGYNLDNASVVSDMWLDK
jgi:peptide/nickel transport system substrate-binding protein